MRMFSDETDFSPALHGQSLRNRTGPRRRCLAAALQSRARCCAALLPEPDGRTAWQGFAARSAPALPPRPEDALYVRPRVRKSRPQKPPFRRVGINPQDTCGLGHDPCASLTGEIDCADQRILRQVRQLSAHARDLRAAEGDRKGRATAIAVLSRLRRGEPPGNMALIRRFMQQRDGRSRHQPERPDCPRCAASPSLSAAAPARQVPRPARPAPDRRYSAYARLRPARHRR